MCQIFMAILVDDKQEFAKSARNGGRRSVCQNWRPASTAYSVEKSALVDLLRKVRFAGNVLLGGVRAP
jgi:hypothetical protein